MSELKLEVGKRYETVDGRVAFIRSEHMDDGKFYGCVAETGRTNHHIWRDGTGRAYDAIPSYADLIRCLDDEPELVDLTKIDVPFGELDERTQDRFAGAVARGAKVQIYSNPVAAWEDMHIHMPPAWLPRSRYRIKPTYTMPTVDDKVWLAMPSIKAIAWDKNPHQLWAYTEEPELSSASWGANEGRGFSLCEGVFGGLIQRGDCPWDQAIVLRPEGM